MYNFVVFAVVAFATALAEDQPCSEVVSVDNFQYSNFARGKWYLYARYKSTAKETAKCGQAKYQLEGDIFKIKDCNVLNGKQNCVNGSGKLAPDAENHGKLIYSYPHGRNGTMIASQVSVLATDYKNYAVLYFCKYIKEKKMRVELSWVLSRSTNLSNDTMAVVDNFIKDSPVVDSKRYILGIFSEEACKIES